MSGLCSSPWYHAWAATAWHGTRNSAVRGLDSRVNYDGFKLVAFPLLKLFLYATCKIQQLNFIVCTVKLSNSSVISSNLFGGGKSRYFPLRSHNSNNTNIVRQLGNHRTMSRFGRKFTCIHAGTCADFASGFPMELDLKAGDDCSHLSGFGKSQYGQTTNSLTEIQQCCCVD